MLHHSWPATLDSLTSIQNYIQHHTVLAGVHVKQAFSIQLIVEEVIANIINHAYRNTDSGIITIGVEFPGDTVSISFSDTGPPFDPLGAAPPDITEDIEERNIGGLGILMVTQMADRIEYHRRDNKNILTVRIKMMPSSS
ncbi:MAG: ATP-binding protein, partial [Desulfobacterium sp.]